MTALPKDNILSILSASAVVTLAKHNLKFFARRYSECLRSGPDQNMDSDHYNPTVAPRMVSKLNHSNNLSYVRKSISIFKKGLESRQVKYTKKMS
jgi:hypothetical protein